MPKPVLQAMVLADHVYRDSDTGKFVIAGTFGNIVIGVQKTVPSDEVGPTEIQGEHRTVDSSSVTKAGSPYLYLGLTSVHGKVALRLKYVDLSDSSVLMEAQIEVTSASPLTLAEYKIPLPPLPIKLGSFSLDLLHDGEILGSWRVTVLQLEPPPTESQL